MRKELEAKLAKLFSVPTDSPSYDELFVFLEDAENELAIAKHDLSVTYGAWQCTEQALHAAWDVINFIEDQMEDLLNPQIDSQVKHDTLFTIAARIAEV